MRFEVATLIAALATTSVADLLWAVVECDWNGNCNRVHSTFYTSYGSYSVDASDGCRGTSVPGMTEFCLDWSRSRGHFKYSHQSFKRCLVMTSITTLNPPGSSTSSWEERACTWRLPAPEEASNPANGTAETTVSVVAENPVPVATGAPQQ
ncbi:hypothetical protein QIS74_10411 [Colletotrichum tabaci]|uniref:Uncharacterized protein n=1 Tax=Colletotrichum tabaci TaxID=1209068 RepID=A0AAV9T2Y9_9PEZI